MMITRLLVSAAFLLALAVQAEAAGTCTQAHSGVGNIRKVTITCTGDAADGSFPATALVTKIEGRLLALVTNPGTTAPTDNYDITLVNQHGADVLQGVGVDRDTLNTEQARIVYSGSAVHPAVDETDTLTLTIANSIVNSAAIVIELYYALGG
jgi:hypothetical protein